MSLKKLSLLIEWHKLIQRFPWGPHWLCKSWQVVSFLPLKLGVDRQCKQSVPRCVFSGVLISTRWVCTPGPPPLDTLRLLFPMIWKILLILWSQASTVKRLYLILWKVTGGFKLCITSWMKISISIKNRYSIDISKYSESNGRSVQVLSLQKVLSWESLRMLDQNPFSWG